MPPRNRCQRRIFEVIADLDEEEEEEQFPFEAPRNIITDVVSSTA